MPSFQITSLEYSGCEIIAKTISDEVPKTELCYLEIEGPVAIITISRKEVFNALNAQLISELIDLIAWTSSRSVAKNKRLEDSNGTPYFRALVLKSEGKHFCAGADVNMMRDAGAASPEGTEGTQKDWIPCLTHSGHIHASLFVVYKGSH